MLYIINYLFAFSSYFYMKHSLLIFKVLERERERERERENERERERERAYVYVVNIFDL
jgi:hypothetical protein